MHLHIHTHVRRQSNQTGWCVRMDYKDSDNGEQLRMCSGVWNEGKLSPGGREMVTSGDEREERRPGLLTVWTWLRNRGMPLFVSILNMLLFLFQPFIVIIV